MCCDKVFLVSYKKNKLWNEVSHYSKKRFEKMGFRVEMIEGYNLKEHPEIKRNRLVYINFLKTALPKSKQFLDKNKKYKGVFIAEDDSWITVDLNELKKIVKLKRSGNVKWIGYQKKLKTGNTFFYVGAQLLWIPREKIDKLKNIMEEKTPQHLNGFFSKNINEIGIDIVKRRGLVEELKHTSLTTGKVRPGKILNNVNFS
tara:strand:- start:628 stop:1230 length:603 start_codon:yes stop_codon:yes gene_type:complete